MFAEDELNLLLIWTVVTMLNMQGIVRHRIIFTEHYSLLQYTIWGHPKPIKTCIQDLINNMDSTFYNQRFISSKVNML